MKKREGALKVEPKKDFLWWGLRISFFGMTGLIIVFFVITFLLTPYSTISNYILLGILFLTPLFALSSFIFSIINLIKEKSKQFSIGALIWSLIVILISIGAIILSKNIYSD